MKDLPRFVLVASDPPPRCGARKALHSSVYCEKPPGHRGEHAGRTRCGYWKFWLNVEKTDLGRKNH